MADVMFHRYLAHVDDRVGGFGSVRSVYHDKRSGGAHVDVLIIDAELAGVPRIVLLTVGCALIDRGPGVEPIEMAMVLPESWPITLEELEKPELFWPFAWLRFVGRELARLPYGPLPGEMVRLPHKTGMPAPTRFTTMLGVPGAWIHDELGDGFVRPDGQSVRVTGVIPIDEDERAWAIARGRDRDDGAALLEALDERRAEALVIDNDRGLLVLAN